MKKQDVIAYIGTAAFFALCVLAAVGFVYSLATCDFEWRTHAAERALGPGALCGEADGKVVACVHDGQAYHCVVSGSEPSVSCAKASSLIR